MRSDRSFWAALSHRQVEAGSAGGPSLPPLLPAPDLRHKRRTLWFQRLQHFFALFNLKFTVLNDDAEQHLSAFFYYFSLLSTFPTNHRS
jgi:hypothetical protein